MEQRVPWAAVGAYVVVAFGLAWLVATPLWLGGRGLADPGFKIYGLLMMLTPTAAALLVTALLIRPARPWRFLGFVPTVRPRRFVALCLVGLLGPIVMSGVVLGLAGGLGWAPVDWSFRSYGAHLAALGGRPLPAGLDLTTVAVATVAALPVNSVIGAIPAVGEEIGWRGFLLPRLAPLGTWPALLLSGVVWGVWHAPLVLLGYNYAYPYGLGVLAMAGFCVLTGIGIGALRLQSGSIWPGALAHGALNTTASVVLLVFSPQPAADIGLTLLGPTGWAVLALLAVLLGLGGALRWRTPATVVPTAPVVVPR